ncbi:LysR family transcriptional regulator [Rhodoferax sp.]|uniref:LysR family transcriptional regulator n=1 Tax=Rhodoferax sp. TaxID=50421 RepID=UPI003524DCAD
MDLTRLQYFVAVAEAGSFSRAAAALHMSQPALSRQILLLEEEVRQRLLERTGRGALPTESGLAMLAHARGIFDLAERARVDMHERQLSPRLMSTRSRLAPSWAKRSAVARPLPTDSPGCCPAPTMMATLPWRRP